MSNLSADAWYRRFDPLLLSPANELNEEGTEVLAWLHAFDDTVLGMPGRRDPRRRWCEDAFATQGVVRDLGRLPGASDTDVPDLVRSWVAAQPKAELNAFQAAWWAYVQYLSGRRSSALSP